MARNRESTHQTFTDELQVTVTEACGTLAVETAHVVYTHTMSTDAWDFMTFINIWKDQIKTIKRGVKTTPTTVIQISLTGKFDFTFRLSGFNVNPESSHTATKTSIVT